MSKKLFTEANVRAMSPGSELVLEPGDIATPSALELAVSRRIRVRRTDGHAGGRRPTPGPWNQILAQDGSYVVEVRAGRADVFRLTETGPVMIAAAGEGGL